MPGAPKRPPLLLACTGGCPWQYVWNAIAQRADPDDASKHEERIKKHTQLFTKLFLSFIKLWTLVGDAPGVYFAIEWPRSCRYWKCMLVKKFLNKLTAMVQTLDFDGCAYGLQGITPGTRHKPIKKPWRVITTLETLRGFLNKRCVCIPGSHVECRGADCRYSEGYTEEIVEAIHQAFRLLSSDTIPRTCPCIYVPPSNSLSTTCAIVISNLWAMYRRLFY